MSRILVVSAHPDDETLGCGGTLLKHAQSGHHIEWMIASRATEPGWTRANIVRKLEEVQAVARCYNVARVTHLEHGATMLDTIPFSHLLDDVRAAIAVARPEIVYLVHEGDVHSDHTILFRAVMTVLKPFYMNKLGVRRILSFETLSSTEAAWGGARSFFPSVYSDISSFIDEKVRIMGLYSTEIHQDPMPRGPSSIRALARYRGATIAVEYAEAFQLIREIQD